MTDAALPLDALIGTKMFLALLTSSRPNIKKALGLSAMAGRRPALMMSIMWALVILTRTLAYQLSPQNIEQLLRALDLNSPVPFAHHPPPGLLHNTSPDLSPISATSSLLTPTDSPARTSCLKIDIPYDHHSSVPSPQGLQLQTGAYRTQDIFSTQSSRFPPPQLSYPYQPQEGALYEPFSERSSIISSFPPPGANPMHAGDRRVPPDLPWYSDRIQPPTDWLRPDDCVRDRCSGLVAEESCMTQKVGSTSPQGSQGILQGNEVKYIFLCSLIAPC